MKTHVKCARKMLGHTPKIDKPCLLFAVIACFLAAKCSVSTKFWTSEQSPSPWIHPWYKGMKLTRLTCVWLYDTTGGKVVSSRWQLYQVQMRENHLCTKREGKSLNKRGKRERSREGGRERQERERDIGYENVRDRHVWWYGTPELRALGGNCTIQWEKIILCTFIMTEGKRENRQNLLSYVANYLA